MKPIDTRARDELITGKPPRIAPLKQSELPQATIDAQNALYRSVGRPETGEVTEFVATMSRYPELHKRHTDLAVLLFDGALPARDRELVVLCVGWFCQAPYEWGQHVAITRRLGILTAADVARVIEGSAAPGWSDRDRAVLRATEELLSDAMISEDTWALLSGHLDEKQLLELPIVVGQYLGIAYLQNSIRARLMPGNPGLSAR